MMRPCSFAYNFETAGSNHFQKIFKEEGNAVLKKAQKEFDALTNAILKNNIDVLIFEDTKNPPKPDAVFPNNWFSTHVGRKLILYPMLAPNRRKERRKEIVEQLQKKFSYKDVIDLSGFEKQNKFLEGTGSLVFDHQAKKVYASLSERTCYELVIYVARLLKYAPVVFSSADASGKEIYHTNVFMTIGSGFAVVCSEAILDERQKEIVLNSLREDGLEIIFISHAQLNNFCGNLLQLKDKSQIPQMVMSKNAWDNFDIAQREKLEKHTGIIISNLTTIEGVGGGSARCMLAELFY